MYHFASYHFASYHFASYHFAGQIVINPILIPGLEYSFLLSRLQYDLNG